MGPEGVRDWSRESERGVWFWLNRHSICTPHFNRKNELILFRGRKTISAPKFWSPGVNTASMYPRVPKLFRWLDPASGEELIAMWHGRGYGGFSVAEAVRAKGLGHVLVTQWNG